MARPRRVGSGVEFVGAFHGFEDRDAAASAGFQVFDGGRKASKSGANYQNIPIQPNTFFLPFVSLAPAIRRSSSVADSHRRRWASRNLSRYSGLEANAFKRTERSRRSAGVRFAQKRRMASPRLTAASGVRTMVLFRIRISSASLRRDASDQKRARPSLFARISAIRRCRSAIGIEDQYCFDDRLICNRPASDWRHSACARMTLGVGGRPFLAAESLADSRPRCSLVSEARYSRMNFECFRRTSGSRCVRLNPPSVRLTNLAPYARK